MTDQNSDNHGALSGPAPEDATPPTPPSDREVANRFMNGLSPYQKAQYAREWLKEALETAQEHKFVSQYLVDDLECAVGELRDASGVDDLESAKWRIESLLIDCEQDWDQSNASADDAVSSLEQIELDDIEWPEE